MSIDNTRLINGLFIIIVVSSHTYICFHGLEYKLCATDIFYKNYVVSKIGQLMVTSFFFFSGYGIMLSYDKKENYSKVIFKRLIKLFINFNIAILPYIVLNLLINKSDFINNITFRKVIGSALAWDTYGNQNWFIFATFSLYLFCGTAFNLLKTRKKHIIVGLITFFTCIYIYAVGISKPYYWIDTILCFPAGMYFYLIRSKFENLIHKAKIPTWSIGLLLILSSQAARYFALHFRINGFLLDFLPAIIINIISITLAIGIMCCFSSITWKKMPKIAIWMGGTGLFPIYIMHNLPMIFLQHFNIHHIAPNLFIFIIIATTALLSYAMSLLFGKLSQTKAQSKSISLTV